MSKTVEQLYNEYQEAAKRLTDAMRPDPPEPVSEYTFQTPRGSVTLTDLFGDRDELLLIRNMGKACSFCTLWADGLNGQTDHYADRSAFVVVSPDEPDVQAEFARSRGWAFPMASCAGTTFAKDMGYEPEPGKHWPGASAFLKQPDGSIVRTGRTMFGPGDPYCPIWHLMDILPRGRGEWAPKLAY